MTKCLHPSTKELVKCTYWDNSGFLPLALYVSENLIGLLHRLEYMMSLLRQISGILFYSYWQAEVYATWAIQASLKIYIQITQEL